MVLDPHGIKVETSKRKIPRKTPNTWILTNTLLNNLCNEGEVSKDNEKPNKNNMKTCHVECVGCT